MVDLTPVLLLAAMNAFNEELTYRAALLSQLAPRIGNSGSGWAWFVHTLLDVIAFGFAAPDSCEADRLPGGHCPRP